MLKNERHVRAGLAAASQSSVDDEGACMSSSLSLGDSGRSMRLGEHSELSGGSSKLSRAAVGSAAVQAALTLLPCVHVAGCGDASHDVMHTMLSSVGPCRIHLFRNDETGESTGELSCTYENAAAAMIAIERFDGSRFDDSFLQVSVAKMAAQGSLTKRGRGRNSDRMTHYDQQQRKAGAALEQQRRSERDAFTTARAAAASTSLAALPLERDAFTPSFKAPASTLLPGVQTKKRSAPTSKLPAFVIKRSAAGTERGGYNTDARQKETEPLHQTVVEEVDTAGNDGRQDSTLEKVEASGVVVTGGLLGLGAYEDSSDSKGDD